MVCPGGIVLSPRGSTSATIHIPFAEACCLAEAVRRRIKRGRRVSAGDTLRTSTQMWRRDLMDARDPAEAVEVLDLLLKFFDDG